MVDEKEFIPITNDGFIPIKATPKNMMPLMNKMILEKIDQQTAHQRHDANPPKFKTEQEYQCQVQQRTRLANGGVVMGNVSEEEKKALNSDSETTIRRIFLARQRALELMRQARLDNKTRGNFYQGLRGGSNGE